jgi:RecB family endonuclease NucS
MEDFQEWHLQEWLKRTVHRMDRDKVEADIKKLLVDHPDLIELDYSWPEMRRMTEV